MMIMKILCGPRPPLRLLPALAFLFALATAPPAGTAPRWLPIGPEGGTVYALATDPATPETLYAGSDAGVWKSVDGGASWSWSSLGMGSTRVADFAIDPRMPSTLYAATNSGVWKSVDGGATWASRSAGITDRRISEVALDPRRPGVVYAATPTGLFKSSDGGESWQPLPAPFKSVTLLALDPRRTATLYVSASDLLYKSNDGGVSWSAGQPLPRGGTLTAIAADPLTSGVVYAAVLAQPGEPFLYKSRNGGATWSPASRGLGDRLIHTLAVSPRIAALYAGTEDGIVRSLDGGGTWQQVLPGGTDGRFLALALAAGPRRSDTVYAGAQEAGITKSVDGGRSWRAANRGLDATVVVKLALGPGAPTTLYVGSDQGRFWQSVDGGESFTLRSPLPPGLSLGALAVDPNQPAVVYAGLSGVILKSTTNGDVWRRKTGGVVLATLATGVIAVDPQNSQTLYAAGGPTNIFRGGCESFKSTDGGTTWTCIPLGILVFHLVIDPTSPQTLYAIAGLDPVVRKSTDGGATWADANQGLAGLRPDGLALSPSSPRTLYVTTSAGIAKSTDAGATWALTAGQGLPTPTPSQRPTEVAVDPANSQVVYAVAQLVPEGTAPARVRVYRSTDGAATWSLLSDGLPRFTGISQLVLDPRRSGVVYLGTYGRGVYELVP